MFPFISPPNNSYPQMLRLALRMGCLVKKIECCSRASCSSVIQSSPVGNLKKECLQHPKQKKLKYLIKIKCKSHNVFWCQILPARRYWWKKMKKVGNSIPPTLLDGEQILSSKQLQLKWLKYRCSRFSISVVKIDKNWWKSFFMINPGRRPGGPLMLRLVTGPPTMRLTRR